MDANQILKSLPPYKGVKKILVHDQNLNQVIDGVVNAADEYKNHYKYIWQFFSAANVKETAKNVFNFLKKNSDYVIEPDTKQSIKSPSAILATGKKIYGGNDCKNFALFTAGVLRAYREYMKQDFELFLRFAGYNGGGLQHVFVVVKKNNTEIWVDPVLNNFDDRTQTPTKIKDYKIGNMALISLSGINPYENNKKLFDSNNPVPGAYVGVRKPGSNRIYGEKMSTQEKVDLGIKIANALKDLFGSKDVPGNYWMAWDSIDMQYGNPIGSQAQHWIVFDGDSVQNEALNIIAYIRANGIDRVIAENATTKRDFGRYVTVDDLINKIKKAGYTAEAEEIRKLAEETSPGSTSSSTKAGMNIFVTVALIGAAVFFLLKKK